MPRGVYKKKKMEQCPKCTKTFNKMGIATHILHCKGVANKDVAGSESLKKLLTQPSVIEQAEAARNEEETIRAALRRAHNDYAGAVKENENLRRIISAYKESNNALCRAMIELNEVEGRWRA